MKKIISTILLISCNNNSFIQKPYIEKKDDFLEKSSQKSREVYEKENSFLEKYVKSNNLKYKKSNFGLWYSITDTSINEKIKPNDTISIFYIVKKLNYEILYRKKETFIVDKSNIIKGLNESVKLLGNKEKGIFIIPSYMAFGFMGDNDKIKSEISLIYEVEIINVKKFNY